MKITNNYNLPEQIVKAVSMNTRKPYDNVISVTELISPVLIRHLRLIHWDEIEEDASERLWALLGQSVHYITEKHQLPESFAEERLRAETAGMTITGQSDNYNAETENVDDWKVTSVWSFLHGIKREWEEQLNCYAWLWNENGFPVKSLKIHAILRDWQKGRAHTADYYDIPFKTIDVTLWPKDQTLIFIQTRIKLHNDPPRPCTNDERWAKEDVFAVMKEGRKSAVKLFDDFKEAFEYSQIDKRYSIVKRPGEFTRCKSYCPVRNFCGFNPYRNQEVINQEPNNAHNGNTDAEVSRKAVNL